MMAAGLRKPRRLSRDGPPCRHWYGLTSTLSKNDLTVSLRNSSSVSEDSVRADAAVEDRSATSKRGRVRVRGTTYL